MNCIMGLVKKANKNIAGHAFTKRFVNSAARI